MPDKDAATPRVFLMRHGETAWSQSGQFTSVTDLPLLPKGETRVQATARVVFGPNKLIDPRKLARVYVSPRQRARQTLQLLQQSGSGSGDGDGGSGDSSGVPVPEAAIEATERIAEWGYGDYEGLLTREIRDLRHGRGLDADRPWDIWSDGCEGPGGENPIQVADRLDDLIRDITALQGVAMGEDGGHATQPPRRFDVLIVAHGHILRAFAKRWLGLDLAFPLALQIEPGGLAGLSYQHGRVDERVLLLGMAFPGGE